MTPAAFASRKPPELRLGQFFYNCYLHKLKPEDNIQKATQELYNTRDAVRAWVLIMDIMEAYQWKELPEYEYLHY